MGKIAEKYANMVIITEDNSRSESFSSIAADILSGIKNHAKVTVIEKRENAIRHAISIAGLDDCIALIGKGNEEYIIDKRGARTFSEREAVKRYFKEVEDAHKA